VPAVQKSVERIVAILFSAVALAFHSSRCIAQQTTGESGSPGATTSLSGKQLPPPDPKFGGVIKDQASESKPWWAPRVVPPKGAPNVLLIMTDDCGFGAPGTFGGVVPTPALDRIARTGLRYTNFHSAALCSPTLAALITGRNHHVSGYGVVGEMATGFPGYDSVIRKEIGTVGAILKENGYALLLSKGELGIGRGKPVFLYNLLDLKRTTWEGPELGTGKHTIVFDFKIDGPGLGKGGTGVLSVDGKEVAKKSMEHTMPITFPEDETFDIGQDTRSAVALPEYRYDVPFKFTGKIHKLTFKLEPPPKAEEKR